ncbi:MAG TPA: Gfo/Idh/MocA family oxidoreductase [Candidatus Avipropionibacterium avicola]|uniref:Gfo/Idh/MocA family oxidoreductase n=1 Tax=Candidatus Avipropionibacterium avicola TaxID=2840701 RepID=A0A9D1KNK2_9ACTN|nr:Gfo/Idh/MocA family oxidoreductase [Candidatus Avipropionibacterium avicola]
MSDSAGGSLRWGVLGPGNIAHSVARDFPLVDGGVLAAVGSRSLDRAQAYADEFSVPKAYGSYREVIEDPEVDALYIATPHPQHLELGLAGAAAGKHLLVEKAFTATVPGAEELIRAVRSAGVFCMEAMWTRFQPIWVETRQLLADGVIGELRQVRAELGVAVDFDPQHRLFDPAQGGGAILDVGIYPISLAHWLLGTPDEVRVTGAQTSTGVDGEAAVLFGYDDGRAALLQASVNFPLPGGALLVGTEGSIEVLPRFHHGSTLLLRNRDGDVTERHLPSPGVGYVHEFDEVHRCVAAGLTESPVMPLDDSLSVQRLLNQACEALGVRHQEDRSVL